MFKKLARKIIFNCSFFKPIASSGQSFQSKHYIPKVSVEQFFNTQQIPFKITQNGFKVKQCPFCTKPHNNQLTNLYTLHVNKQSGVFFCFRCSHRGSWLDFRGKFLGLDNQKQYNQGQEFQDLDSQDNFNSQATITEVQYFLYYENLKKPQFKDVLDYLIEERKLTMETLQKYKVGAGIESFVDQVGNYVPIKVIYFPMFRILSEKEKKKYEKEILDYISMRFQADEAEEKIQIVKNNKINTNFATLSKVKVRGSGKQNKHFMRQIPTNNQSGFFGLNLLNQNTKEVVITQGEFDAMSVYQQTGKIALSLPQGANHLPDLIIPYLDKIEKIIIWMDNDEVGQLNIPKVAMKLGIKRTFIVQNPDKTLKDANDMLRSSKKDLMSEYIDKAMTIPGSNILTFDSMKDKIKNKLFNFDQSLGVKSTCFNFFNKKVKGLRMSQLSILSGGTGSGKTTFLSQLSLDLCKKGVPTLWGSFQIRNQVLMTTMLTQFSNCNLSKKKERFDFSAQQFQKLPLYYLSFYGSTDLDKVFGTIEYAIQKYDISHIIIDTLQFLLSNQAEGFKKFELQDSVMSRLRKITMDYNVHVTVVIHPKKVDEGEDLGIHSIFGTSKAVQQADNVWMIQQRDGFKVFQIKKNRFDGELGKIAIAFDRQTKQFFELKKNQLEMLHKKQTTVQDILEKRQKGVNEDEEQLQRVIQGKQQINQEFTQRKRKNYFRNGQK